MADKLEFNPGALSIFIGLLLLVVTLFIGFMLIKDGGTSGTGRTCGNVYGIDQPNTPYKLQTMDQYLEEKKNELNPPSYTGALGTKVQYRKKMKNKQKQNPHPIVLPAADCGITNFKMFISRKKVKIQFKDSQYADVKKYSFTAVFKSADKLFNDPAPISMRELVGNRNGGESAQKEFIWNEHGSARISYTLKQIPSISEIHVTKEFNDKPKQVAVVSAADITFGDDDMILVD
eukprot:602667_1